MPAGERLIAIGLDFGNAFAMASALGYDVAAVADCLSSAEAGLVVGCSKRHGE